MKALRLVRDMVRQRCTTSFDSLVHSLSNKDFREAFRNSRRTFPLSFQVIEAKTIQIHRNGCGY